MGDNSDWDSTPTETPALHFFPRWGDLVWRVNGESRLKTKAWGGRDPEPGKVYETMNPGRTTPGAYVIHSAGPYVTETWPKSRIAWGTPLRLSADGSDLLYETGQASPRWASALKKTETSLEKLKSSGAFARGMDLLIHPYTDAGNPAAGPARSGWRSARAQRLPLDRTGHRLRQLRSVDLHAAPVHQSRFFSGRYGYTQIRNGLTVRSVQALAAQTATAAPITAQGILRSRCRG